MSLPRLYLESLDERAMRPMIKQIAVMKNVNWKMMAMPMFPQPWVFADEASPVSSATRPNGRAAMNMQLLV